MPKYNFVNINDREFKLNGIPYNKVFIALPSGETGIRVVGIYESRTQLIPPTNIEEVTVNNNTYGTVSSLISAIKEIIYTDYYDEIQAQISGIASGYKGPIAIADTPTEDGYYTPTEAGTYSNAGNLVYDPSGADEGKVVQFIKTGVSWVKNSINYYFENDDDSIIGDVFLSGFYVKSSDGELASSATRKYTDFKEIKDSNKIIFRGFSNGTSVALIAFYDKNKKFISALTSPSLEETEILSANFPNGSHYIRVSGAGDGKDKLIYTSLDTNSKRINEILENDLSKINLIKESQFLTINDTPTNIFNLSNDLTETTITSRIGYGNKVVTDEDRDFNIVSFIPSNLIEDYNGFSRVEIYNVTDNEYLFSKDIDAIVWNYNLDNVLKIYTGELTLTAGKEYQIRYLINDSVSQPINYKRIPKTNNEVVNRVSYVSSWGDVSGDYNVYMELLQSNDISVDDKNILEGEQILNLSEVIENKINEVNTVELFLPDDIYCAVGQTIEIYTKQILNTPNKTNYHVDYSCAVGQHKKRKFTVTGNSVGTHNLTVTVRDNKLKTILTKTINLEIVNFNSVATPYKMLCIGASYTNNKIWYDEWKVLTEAKTSSRNDLDFIGSIQGTWGNHEGRSGWTAGKYLEETTDENSNILITVSGVTELPAIKKAYNVPLLAGGNSVFEVEEYDITAGSGTILLTRTGLSGLIAADGNITELESGSLGDSSITYSAMQYVSVNPFWNDSSNSFDLANYQTVNNVPNPNGVQFLIGTNSLSGGDATINQSNQDIKTLIDNMIAHWGQIEIYVCFIPFLSDQNGLGKTYGSGIFGNKEDLDSKIFKTMKGLYDLLNGYANVYFTPIAQCHDSEFNFGRVEVDVNPRNSEYKDYEPVEGVHPQENGYRQFADIMFATWASNR